MIYYNFLKQPHLLIAGATGSGKSVVINSMIHTILTEYTRKQINFVLIDPKKVELNEYRFSPYCVGYADSDDSASDLLENVVDLMMGRYERMQRKGLRMSDERTLWVFIDEYADLITTARKSIEKSIIRIAQLGRAAKIHLCLATQRPTRDIITGQIKVNLDSRLALRCPTSQDSRNIINVKGAEDLPRYGKGIYLTPETMQPILIDIPIV